MKARSLLIGAALLASAAAMAESTPPANDSQRAEPPPPAIRNAVPDKIAPATDLKALAEPKVGDKAPETTGDAADKRATPSAPLKPGDSAAPGDAPSGDSGPKPRS